MPMISAELLQNVPSRIRAREEASTDALELHRVWEGDVCSLSVSNNGDAAVQLDEVIAFTCDMPYPAETPFYGEGYNKLSQYKGTLRIFDGFTSHSDGGHYRLPQTEGFFTVYNLLHLRPAGCDEVLLGFASCRRFAGKIRFNTITLEVAIDCEGVTIAPGETLQLEQFMAGSGSNGG